MRAHPETSRGASLQHVAVTTERKPARWRDVQLKPGVQRRGQNIRPSLLERRISELGLSESWRAGLRCRRRNATFDKKCILYVNSMRNIEEMCNYCRGSSTFKLDCNAK